MQIDKAEQWERYRERELGLATPILSKLGFTLESEQVHTEGERYLMTGSRDVGGGGYKLVLLGRRDSDKTRVIIKISSDAAGIQEINTEREARKTLQTLTFAYKTLRIPEEIVYARVGHHTIFVTTFIEQDSAFLSRTNKEQFSLALQALKAQESIYATTYAHRKAVRSVFGVWRAQDYLDSFVRLSDTAVQNDPDNDLLKNLLTRASSLLTGEHRTLEQYCGFLTHADFVPHNLRVRDGTVYLLDSASLHFGNKYESWARFANFMLLYNRQLETALIDYVKNNRTPAEVLSLRLMRIYKLAKLLEYHTGTLSQTSGNMHKLSTERVRFWSEVLASLLDDKPLSQDVISQYQRERDSLRSDTEKKRQEALH